MEWSSFKKRIFIKKEVPAVYRAWATRAGIETWFLEEAHFYHNNQPRKPEELVEANDTFSWKWNNWDFREEGKILSANGRDEVSFTFGTGGQVHIRLTPVKEGTEVGLVQEDIPTDDKSKMDIYVGCHSAWTFWLTNLKAYLEHGITLHARGLAQADTKHLVNS